MRKPDRAIEDNHVRTAPPGLDGTILLGVMALLGIALIADMLIRLTRLF